MLSGLLLVGLLVLSNHLRTDSEPTVTELQQQYGHSLDASFGTLCASQHALGCDSEEVVFCKFCRITFTQNVRFLVGLESDLS